MRNDLPRHLSRIITHCLAKEPDRRYQSALDVRNELERLRREVESGDVELSQVSGVQLPPRKSKAPLAAGMVAGLLVVAAVVWGVFLRDDGGKNAAAAGAAQRTLGVIGFENLSDPQDAANLGRMLMSLVTTDLTESGGLGVVSTAKVLAAYRQTGASDKVAFDSAVASETARVAGADVMLVGQILARGEKTMLTAELVDVASGNTLGSVKHEAADSDELFALAGSIASDVRESLGVGGTGREFDLAGTLTDSAEAYRQYVAGDLALHAAHYEDAIDRYETAVRLDATFAWAYYRLGVAQGWSGLAKQDAFERGAPYVERLPERWQIVYTATWDYERARPDAAVASLERLLREEPDIPDAYNILGELQTHFSRHMNNLAAMRNFETALEIDPTFKVVFFHLLDNYMLRGDEAAIERLIQRTVDDDPDHLWTRLAEVYRLYIQDRPQDVVRAVERLDDTGDAEILHYPNSLGTLGEWERLDRWVEVKIEGASGFLRSLQLGVRAWGAYSRGRLDAALRDSQAASTGYTSSVTDSLAAEAIRFGGHVNEIHGRFEAAEELFRRSIEVDPFYGASYWALARLLSSQGRLDEARRLLATFERDLSPDPDATNRCWAHLLRGEILFAEGDAPGAREAVSRLRPESCWVHDEPSAWLRAESHEREGNFAAAATAWRDVIEPAHPRYPTSFSFEIPAWHRLGLAHERKGETDRALDAYRRVLDAWGDGDPGIFAVDDSRARLAALGG